MTDHNAKHWWTYCGNVGGDCNVMAHASRDAAEFHYGQARGMGGDFNRIGRTQRPAARDEVFAYLRTIFAGVWAVPSPDADAPTVWHEPRTWAHADTFDTSAA